MIDTFSTLPDNDQIRLCLIFRSIWSNLFYQVHFQQEATLSPTDHTALCIKMRSIYTTHDSWHPHLRCQKPTRDHQHNIAWIMLPCLNQECSINPLKEVPVRTIWKTFLRALNLNPLARALFPLPYPWGFLSPSKEYTPLPLSTSNHQQPDRQDKT